MTELEEHLKPLTYKNAQLVTRYIKNWADSAKYEVFSSHLILCSLTVKRSVMPNFSYTQPLTNILKGKVVFTGLTTQMTNSFL